MGKGFRCFVLSFDSVVHESHLILFPPLSFFCFLLNCMANDEVSAELLTSCLVLVVAVLLLNCASVSPCHLQSHLPSPVVGGSKCAKKQSPTCPLAPTPRQCGPPSAVGPNTCVFTGDANLSWTECLIVSSFFFFFFLFRVSVQHKHLLHHNNRAGIHGYKEDVYLCPAGPQQTWVILLKDTLCSH